MDNIKPYAKAAVAILGAVVTALIQAFPDQPEVTRWATFASTIITAIAVYVVPNTDPTAEHQDESVQPPTVEVEDPGTVSLAAPDKVKPDPYWDTI